MHDTNDFSRSHRFRIRRRVLGAVILVSLFVGGASGAEAGDDQGSDRSIQLTAAQREEFGVDVRVAAPAEIDIVVELPGEVRPDQNRVAHLVPRFSGIAVEVRRQIGDEVEAGEVLARIESNESLSSYSIQSLIQGTVVARHLTLGEEVSQETLVFTVANLDTVWVDLSVYQSDQARVRVGNRVRILADRDHVSGLQRIAYVSPILDRKTRTATARVILPNPDRRWKPGLFVTGEVVVDSKRAAVAVPRSAIQTLDGLPVVFVLDGDRFTPRPVRKGLSDQDRIEILEGLSVGESYAARGSFLLKSELEKSGFGE